MKILAVIQARCGSTRLSGKVLMPLAGIPVLSHVIRRVRASRLVDAVVVATTRRRRDDPVAALCAREGVGVYRGSENDVLDRYYRTARPLRPLHVVRITADCPLMDPEVIDTVVAAHLRSQADYTSNTLRPSYPDGEDVEVFRLIALERAWKEARWTSEREHVTPYIWKHPKLFRLHEVRRRPDLSSRRWTLDMPEDYAFIRRVFAELYPRGPLFGMRAVLSLLRRNPALARINARFRRNEGYAKSTAADRRIGGRTFARHPSDS